MRPCAQDDDGRDRVARCIFVEVFAADGAVHLVELRGEDAVEHRQCRSDSFGRGPWESSDFDVVVLQPSLPTVRADGLAFGGLEAAHD